MHRKHLLLRFAMASQKWLFTWQWPKKLTHSYNKFCLRLVSKELERILKEVAKDITKEILTHLSIPNQLHTPPFECEK